MAFKVGFTLLALLVVTTYAKTPKAPLLAADSPTAVEGSYIVVLKEELSNDQVEGHKNMVRSVMQLHGNTSRIKFEYKIGKRFRGYSVGADEKMVEALRSMKEVKYIERNQVVHAFQEAECEYQEPAEWGLHRTVDRDTKPGNEFYQYDKSADGSGVDVYIIDTGIYINHNEFSERASFGVDVVDNPSFPGNGDPNGHGTHVAGTVIGNKYGLARGATAIAVRVLNAFGSGSYEGVIEGVEWTAQQGNGKKSVANMSLGGGKSQAMNDAVDAAVKDAGVHFAIAAGNDNFNACNYSPASAPECVSVGATDDRDYRSYFSNYGTCVDIFAPGSGIQSAYPGSPDSTATLSGTSMAAPHVAGVMAKILSDPDSSVSTPDEMKAELVRLATKDILQNPGSGSPNFLLYHPCLPEDVEPDE